MYENHVITDHVLCQNPSADPLSVKHGGSQNSDPWAESGLLNGQPRDSVGGEW